MVAVAISSWLPRCLVLRAREWSRVPYWPRFPPPGAWADLESSSMIFVDVVACKVVGFGCVGGRWPLPSSLAAVVGVA